METWRHRFNCLIKLGISKQNASKLVMSRKPYWNCAHNPVMDGAISNKRL